MPIKTPLQSLIKLEADLATLLDDIHHIRVHGRPSSTALVDGAHLADWSIASTVGTCLVGRVTGHPLLGDRPQIRTSPLFLLDAEQGWARTWSRFYRLGPPHRPECC